MSDQQKRTDAALGGHAPAKQSAERPGIEPDAPLAYGAHILPPDQLPIIAIGTSAGGLEAVSRLLDAISSDIAHGSGDDTFPDIVFLLVQHLDPTHHSLLAELLTKHTAMTVVEASDGCPMVAAHVYIIPPGR